MSKFVCETQVVSSSSQNLEKTVEHSKSIEHSQKELTVHATAQHVGHSKVAEGQNVECSQKN